ncbi:unnamed protein product [Ixodes pacificus]
MFQKMFEMQTSQAVMPIEESLCWYAKVRQLLNFIVRTLTLDHKIVLQTYFCFYKKIVCFHKKKRLVVSGFMMVYPRSLKQLLIKIK